MAEDEELKRILDEFMKNASDEDIMELNRLLETRKSSPRGGAMDVNSIARDMSRQLNERIGLSEKNIKSMARDMVVKLAREHKPDITDAELRVLVRHMVPGPDYSGVAKKLPPAVLKTMILHFVTYGTGRMSEAEKSLMPAGWTTKYWQVFPPEIRRLISSFLKGSLDAKVFWQRIVETLGDD